MTQEQENISEQFISELKEHGGVLDYQKTKAFESADKKNIGAIIKALKDKNIIDDYVRDTTVKRLTETGWHFKGFEAERKEAKEQQEFKNKKDKIDLANAERVYKSYPVTRFLAWAGAISGAIALLLKLAELFGMLHQSGSATTTGHL